MTWQTTFISPTKIRWPHSRPMHETSWLRLSRLYCIRQARITNGTTETATMAAEYRGIFLAARSPLSFVSSRERRANLFDRRVDGHPPPRVAQRYGAHTTILHTIPLRFKRHRVHPARDTIAMIAEISWRARYGIQCFSLSQVCESEADCERATIPTRTAFNLMRERGDRAAQPATHEGGRVASARSAWRTDCGDNCHFLSAA